MTSAVADPISPSERFNLAQFCLGAASHPERIALIVAMPESGQSWSYGALDHQVRRVAAGLLADGLTRGGRVLIRLGGLDYVLAFLGTVAAGCVAVPASLQLTDGEAAFLASDARVDRVIADPADMARLAAFEPTDYAATGPEDPAYLIYTSGTTSRPKGVLHAHRAILGRRPMHEAWLGLGPDDVVLHAGTVNWTYTLGVGLLDPWSCGASAILWDGPREPALWPALIERFRATVFAAVPGVYRQMIRSGALARHDLSSLRHGVTAGEALPPALLDLWREATGRPLYEALGQSEISTYISSGPSVPTRPGSPGRPQPGRLVAVLPVEGGETPLAPGEIGLLAVHRDDPGLMLGYWERPDEMKASIRGAWFLGGDLASIDADGYVWHHGRADEVMNTGGYRVSPAEVEAVLLAHPMVGEVAVTERRVRPDVSIIAAFVVLRPGQVADAATLLTHAAGRLAAYKCPRDIQFVEALPRTANGKVMRKRLGDGSDQTPG